MTQHVKINIICKEIVFVLLVLAWCWILKSSQAYISPYLVLAVIGIACFFYNERKPDRSCQTYETLLQILFAAVLSFMISLSNYDLFAYQTNLLVKYILPIIVFIAGFWLWKSILLWLCQTRFTGLFSVCQKIENRLRNGNVHIKPLHIFFLVWIVVALIDGIWMYFAYYPGVLVLDSIDEITQMLTGVYSNHHPYYFTQWVHVILALGMQIFGNLTQAVALYSFVQILVVSCTIAFVISTLYLTSLSRVLVFLIAVFYAVMPYHIMYSFSMFKDTLFGVSVLLVITAFYRIAKGLGKYAWVNAVILTIACVGTCLFRSNGWIAFTAMAIISGLFLFRKKAFRKILVLFVFAIVFSYVLKNPVLTSLNVTQPDTIESLSIPAQQIARVVTEQDDLTVEQREVLNEIIAVDEIPDVYQDYISDPIKELVRETGGISYLKNHLGEFAKLYIELGLSHPRTYLYAWVDQTKGFWNSGYDYWVWSDVVHENELGLSREVKSNLIGYLAGKYLGAYVVLPVMNVFISLGVHVWILLVIFFLGLVKRNKILSLMTLLLLCIVGTLLVATPVFCEFRYAYAVMTCLPFLVGVYLMDESTSTKTKKKNEGIFYMITLRALKEKDALLMLEWMHDKEIQKGFQKDMLSMTLEKAADFCRSQKLPDKLTDGCSLHFAVVNEDDEYLGTISLKNVNIINKNAEYAIVLRSCVQKQGIGKTATILLLKKAFEEYGLHKVYLNVLKDNEGAIRLYEKCGFIHEGESREHVLINGEYKTWEWYGIVDHEFEHLFS